ncbi:MAG: UDP-N-acetylmuramate--L-alanine ligase [Treponema sp.]|jgi:UDP-N-acetylmuramate--alanine ligase|nr:UDP-N-acetylmuramate--L-alanine ligase [Treponema sp.]
MKPVIYMVGIKGTGMCALAELLHNTGAEVRGSDRPETFYTDLILQDLGIPYYESFEAAHIDERAEQVIYSAAYSPGANPELLEARRRGIPLIKYSDALGEYSARFDSSGIAGVHGKTTTTALTGMLLRGAGLPAQVLAGSAVGSFSGSEGGRSTLCLGDKYFVAETCEYRRHFLAFHPRRIVLTSVESDHQDYYPGYADIQAAFLEYIAKLPQGGELIYCADDAGARETAARALGDRPDIRAVPYGFSAGGPFQITGFRAGAGGLVFGLAGLDGEWHLRIPGRHSALNAAAALALTDSLVRAEFGLWSTERLEKARTALGEFRGSKRRSEILGESGGVLFMDDYGHHPTAIRTTLAGLRDFYPGRRIVLSFMSHTYSRTAALLDEFAASFESADVVFFHKIYASAREGYTGGVTGRTLYERARAQTRPERQEHIHYTEEWADAAGPLEQILRAGDLFITLGAGDNWKLGKMLMDRYHPRPEEALL